MQQTPRRHTHTHKLVLYLAHEHTRGLEGQPPAQYEHEVVTGDGVVDTLLQATRRWLFGWPLPHSQPTAPTPKTTRIAA